MWFCTCNHDDLAYDRLLPEQKPNERSITAVPKRPFKDAVSVPVIPLGQARLRDRSESPTCRRSPA